MSIFDYRQMQSLYEDWQQLDILWILLKELKVCLKNRTKRRSAGDDKLKRI